MGPESRLRERVFVERSALLADEFLTGAAWCRAHSDLVDGWLATLLAQAQGAGGLGGLALVAIGGYGRAELAPGSDIDVMLLHDGHPDVRAVAERLWYPIWEKGLRLGHSVATPKEALRLAAEDMDTATSLLSARHVAGDPALTQRLADGARVDWERRSKHWLADLTARVEARHAQYGEVAFRLEPDLKEGRGGLRDEHSLRWAEAAHRVLLEYDGPHLAASYAVLLDARVELQRLTGRPTNVLAIQEQTGVARALGLPGPDALMARVADAARTLAWTSDDAFRRIATYLRNPLARRIERPRPLGPGMVLAGGEVLLTASAPLADPLFVLRVAAAAARSDAALDRASLERLAANATTLPEPWPGEARSLLVDLLATGPSAIGVIEALDQRGLWGRLLPEWSEVRALPPRSAYHRYTVDRHLLEATAKAAGMADRVERPDLLLVATLLHDLGKGSPGDHSSTGAVMVRAIGERMGFPGEDIDTLSLLVELHLLLPEVATRRDLDDPTTVRRVAEAAGSPERLYLLATITEADSLATGPLAWGPWKADLVRCLVERADAFLVGVPADTPGPSPCRLPTDSFPSPAQLRRLAEGGQHLEGRGNVLTVMNDDLPGMFSRVAGVLALHGLNVLAAAAYSTEDGRALSEFRVDDIEGGAPPWPKVVHDLRRALDGELALHARVVDRARTYARRRPVVRTPATPSVSFDNQASETATVIDVRGSDGIGRLYRITRTLADFYLDIRSARVQTLGADVVDAFYVRDRNGAKITDAARLVEIERAILHVLDEEY